jgi:predicted transcriptional regulator
MDDNMPRQRPYLLSTQDDKIIKVFTDLGMPRNLAKTLVYISQVEECKSAQLEQGANLRQPEVSVAMHELTKKGWIRKRDVKKKGKGRPVHLYKLTSSLDDIIKSFEKEKMKEIDIIKNDLEQLRSLINKR